MKKLGLILIFLIFGKGLLCQNFLNYNSTPYGWFGAGGTIFSDSSDNKYTIGQVGDSYSSSKFSFTFPNTTSKLLLIKYDSLNIIKYYKKISFDWTGNNYGYYRSFFYDNYLYLAIYVHAQYSYDNASFPASHNLALLKIDPTNGNLISTFPIEIPDLGTISNYSVLNSIKNLFIKDNKISIFLETKSPIVLNSININTGFYCAIYSLGGNFLFAKNLTPYSYNDILEYNGSIYVFGVNNNFTGCIWKYYLSYNLKQNFIYGPVPHSPVLLNNKILFASDNTPYYKIYLSLVDTNLNVLKETTWGTRAIHSDQNSYKFLDIKNNKIILSYIAALSKDSALSCSGQGRSPTNIIIHTLDTNLNCKNSIQIANGNTYAGNTYTYFVWNYSLTVSGQISFLINSTYDFSRSDSLFRFYINSHKYALGKMEQGNLDGGPFYDVSADIASFYFDKWLEAFNPDKIRYCIGDTLKLAYKKAGEWHPGTIFRLEISQYPDFKFGSVRLIGTFIDSATSKDTLLYARLKIPAMGGGQFYLRIRSVDPDRTSNLADTTIIIYSFPVANAGADINVCKGDTAKLQGMSSTNNFYWTSSTPSILNDSLILNPKAYTRDSAYCVLHSINGPGCESTDTVYLNLIPEINLKSDIDSIYPRCINSDVLFSLTTSYNDSIILNWGEGADSILKGNTHILRHHYLSIGNKSLSIKAIANKCSDSTGFNFIVRPSFAFKSSNDTSICKGRPVTIWGFATGGDSSFSYVLKASGQIISDSLGIFVVKPDTTTIYYLGAVSGCLGDTLWDTITITVRSPISIRLNSNDTTICKGTVYSIRSNTSGGNGKYFYSLKKNNQPIQFNGTGDFQVLADVNAKYSVTVTDSCTIKDDSAILNLRIFDTIYFKQLIRDINVCAGEPLTVKADLFAGNNKLKYAWYDASGNVLSATDSLSIIPASSMQVMVKADASCQTITDTFWIYRFAEAAGTKLIADNTTGCAPLTVNFESPLITYSNTNAYEALWDFGDGKKTAQNISANPSILKIQHIYSNPGVYKAILELKNTNASGVCISFNCTIEALNIPQIIFSVIPRKITKPENKCIAHVSCTNADSVSIDWADGTGEAFTQNLDYFTASHIYMDTGEYFVKANAFNKNTCYSEKTIQVFYSDLFTCFVPEAFSPNKDHLNDLFKPVLTYCKSYEMDIYDRWGTLVFHESFIQGKNQQTGWSGDQYFPGAYIYILRATDGENKSHTVQGLVMLIR
jgi:hypothetical protein